MNIQVNVINSIANFILGNARVMDGVHNDIIVWTDDVDNDSSAFSVGWGDRSITDSGIVVTVNDDGSVDTDWWDRGFDDQSQHHFTSVDDLLSNTPNILSL